MFVLIVGAGRVGSALAKSALANGHEVSVLDADPLSHERLDAGQSKTWEDADGQFTVGTALETDALIQAWIERADVFIASTAGDNTNLVIAQIAQKRFGVEKAIVLGAEEPSLIRGGGRLGGRGGPLEGFVGDVTKYVVRKATCRVIVTAPAARDSPVEQARRPNRANAPMV